MRQSNGVRSGRASTPREFFRACESGAIRIRKLLRSARMRRRRLGTSGLIDDAVALAELIERLAEFGQSLAAADAMDLAERLEHLLDQLRAEVDSLLAS